MSLQKHTPANHQKEQLPHINVHGPLTGVAGVNSSLQHYSVALKGTANQNLWVLNLSSQPGEQRRLLSILGASTFLVNYAQDSYPARIDVCVGQITGAASQSGQETHSIATLVPVGAAVPVYNTGGVIGYNLAYGLLGEVKSFDISNIPSLTFDATIGEQMTPVTYPLGQSIVLAVQITHVVF